MEIKRTMVASQLIIEAGEQYHKRPTQLNFEELVDVVKAIVRNCSIPPVSNNEVAVCKPCNGSGGNSGLGIAYFKCVHCNGTGLQTES